MTAQFQLALFGALPAILAMAYVDHLDAKRPEPRRTLRLVALAGALSAVLIVAVGALLRPMGPLPGTYAAAFYDAFVVAAVPEELAKLGCMLAVAWRRPEFDERMDGIVYGARAGLGFALVENVAYLLLIPNSLGEFISLFFARALLAVPGHAAWGAILGYFAARRRFDGRGPGMLGGLGLAIALHGLYDVVAVRGPGRDRARAHRVVAGAVRHPRRGLRTAAAGGDGLGLHDAMVRCPGGRGRRPRPAVSVFSHT